MTTNTSKRIALRAPVPPADADRRPADAPPTRHRWRLAASLAAVVLALAGTLVAASPASAYTPTCTTAHGFRYADINGDKLLGVGPGYIDYVAWAPAARYSDGGYRWSCLMSKGAHSTAVFQLQGDINACYGSYPQWGGVKLGLHLVEDGDFGPATKAALIKVQQYHKITADGVYGPQTAITMRHTAWAYSGDIGTGTFCHTLGG